MNLKYLLIGASLLVLSLTLSGAAPSNREFHVSPRGNDGNDGSRSKPLQTISAAAALAQPGDTVTVHAGVYREQVNPPRGGESETARIIYRAAPGEKVTITGSEMVQNWVKVQNDTWKATLPNSFFGKFNPYSDLIHGDWFSPNGRQHHTGAVYLNGDWLIEAVRLEDVLNPVGSSSLAIAPTGGYLVNLAWFRTGKGNQAGAQIPADRYAAKQGPRTAACSEGGQCIGWIENGHWVRYEAVDFGKRNDTIEFRAASPSGGGLIEIRLDAPDGKLLGTCAVLDTGDWQTWVSFSAKIKPTSGRQNLCLVFKSSTGKAVPNALWFAEVDQEHTTIWAQFKGVNPNRQSVEINVRRTVFYPDQPGRNFITVRGFTLEHGASPWAPPSAEQLGIIGTHWSKGWIIENNEIRYSKCCGVALGKYGDEFDNTNDAGSADPYTACVRRALTNGWNRATVGSHVVRSNCIHHCEQTGIVGSLGCSFSTVSDNEIHDIHVHRLFSGAEMAGIKFHGAIDVVIRGNHIHHTVLGIWLDWMAQGAQVVGNLLHDNPRDLFCEVDHGPFLVANNLMLSDNAHLTISQGGAYAHNLIAGGVHLTCPFDDRLTPFHKAHSTEIAGLHNNPNGDVRYYNNLFLKRGSISAYDKSALPVWMAGNVFLKGATACTQEKSPLVRAGFDPGLKLVEGRDGFYLEIAVDPAWATEQTRKIVTTELLGEASIPNLPFENPNGTALRLDTDYFGKKRNERNPFPGPFEISAGGKQSLKVWPIERR